MSKINAVVFSGSFNPVHIGHLAIANYITEFTQADELWFVVSPHNPFKPESELADFHHRFSMVKLAVSDLYMPVIVSDIENSLPQPSYTVNTFEALSAKYPDRQWSMLIGSDNLSNFNKWKNYQQILENHKLLVYPRNGYENTDFYKKYNAIKIEAPLMDISSTFIRKNLAQNRNLRAFLPKGIFEYIMETGLYK